MTLLRQLRPVALGCMLLLGTTLAHAQRGGGRGGMMGGGSRMGRREPGPAQPLRNAPLLAPAGRFWDDKKTVKALNLRPDQQKRMDDLFNSSKDTLQTLYDNLQREQQRFGSMSPEDLQDESKVFAGIDRVAQARADLEKAHAHFLLQLRKEMDLQQLAELDRVKSRQ